MIIRTIHSKDAPWFAASRATFQARTLSWAARGILAYLLSQADAWEPRTDDLIEQGDLRTDGIQARLRELRQAGHVARRWEWDEAQQVRRWVVYVYENPADNPEREKPVPAQPVREKPEREKPGRAKPVAQIIKNTPEETREEREDERESVGVSSQTSGTPSTLTPTPDNPYDRPAVLKFEAVLGVRPAIFAAEQIAATVQDLEQWEETLAYWNKKRYRQSNIAGMLDNYRRHVEAGATIIGPTPKPEPAPTPAPIIETPDGEAIWNTLHPAEREALHTEVITIIQAKVGDRAWLWDETTMESTITANCHKLAAERFPNQQPTEQHQERPKLRLVS